MADAVCENPRKRNRMLEQTSKSTSTSDLMLTSNSKFGGIGNASDNWMKLKLKNSLGNEEEDEEYGKMETGRRSSGRITELGNGSEVIYYPTFITYDEGWRFFDYLNSHIPWTRPTLRVFGRHCVQPRDSCYVADEGAAELGYSGHKPHAYSWHQFPPLITLLKAVEEGVPGSRFNSLLLNRYKGGNDYVGWHSDDESIYGPTPLIASLSFGCDRPFYLKKKKTKNKKCSECDQHSFTLKHGSLFVMRGYTQRDWIHSVPKRSKLDAVRINLTFRLVL
ncbi:DNA oxidative demethylase ALKBH2 [Bienertia sinuspersici]